LKATNQLSVQVGTWIFRGFLAQNIVVWNIIDARGFRNIVFRMTLAKNPIREIDHPVVETHKILVGVHATNKAAIIEYLRRLPHNVILVVCSPQLYADVAYVIEPFFKKYKSVIFRRIFAHFAFYFLLFFQK
jgi:hypothetical protein